jgi:hypothetical protein
MKFERWLHSVFSTSRSTSGLAEVKVALASVTELIGIDSIVAITALPVIVTRT